ncbi:MAG: hypothetical protein HOE90_02635 [Bacteriovoracaceae bacterium]|nr:hypothetical protein [Bacteriovoracaceae bacterium]
MAGQKKRYIINQLKAFKEGTRHSNFMEPIAQSLSKKEIKSIARLLHNIFSVKNSELQ